MLRGETMHLRDTDIKKLIDDKFIENVPDMTSDPYGPRSPVQPCSLDLTIGKIFVPGIRPQKSGGCKTPKANHSLGAGETAVVETNEIFHLPSQIGAFGFPPTSVSNVGVLVTNLGHFDPGYEGTVKFTLVNMGHEPYSLKRDDPIYTVLFFRLNEAPVKDYRQRYPEAGCVEGVNQELLDKLSRDFLDVSKRAKKAAARAVFRGGLNITILASVLGALAVMGNSLFNTYARVDKLETGLTTFKVKVSDDIAELRSGIQIKTEVQDLRAQIESVRKDVQRLTETLAKRDNGTKK
jgi:deoxycytidine triphosphate deaminase